MKTHSLESRNEEPNERTSGGMSNAHNQDRCGRSRPEAFATQQVRPPGWRWLRRATPHLATTWWMQRGSTSGPETDHGRAGEAGATACKAARFDCDVAADSAADRVVQQGVRENAENAVFLLANFVTQTSH